MRRLTDSLFEACDEAAAEETEIQGREGGIGYWSEESKLLVTKKNGKIKQHINTDWSLVQKV